MDASWQNPRCRVHTWMSARRYTTTSYRIVALGWQHFADVSMPNSLKQYVGFSLLAWFWQGFWSVAPMVHVGMQVRDKPSINCIPTGLDCPMEKEPRMPKLKLLAEVGFGFV